MPSADRDKDTAPLRLMYSECGAQDLVNRGEHDHELDGNSMKPVGSSSRESDMANL